MANFDASDSAQKRNARAGGSKKTVGLLMTKRALLACAVVVTMGTGPALAAGDWTGVYIGVHAGGALGDVDWANVSDTGVDMDFDPGETLSQEPDGVLGGGQLGFNYQMTDWLFGVELSGSGLDFDETSPNPDLGGSEEYLMSEIDWIATAAARLGWTWQESLFYLKGGYAAGQVSTTHVDPGGGDDVVADFYSTDETHNGWVAGAGIEHQLGERVSFGIEYNYIDLGEQDHSGITVGGGDIIVNNIDVQLHTVTARLNWNLWTP